MSARTPKRARLWGWLLGGTLIAATACQGSIASGANAAGGADPLDPAGPSARLDGGVAPPLFGDGGSVEPPMDGGVPDEVGDAAGAGEWPGASNTGVSASMALVPSASIVVNTPGQIVEGKDVQGTITVRARDVVIRNTRIRSSGAAIVIGATAQNVLVEDVTLVGTATGAAALSVRGIVVENGELAVVRATFRRMDLSGFTTGMLMEGGHVVVRDSYFHDLSVVVPEGAGQIRRASDAIVAFSGDNYVIQHNTLEVDADAANCVVKFPCDLPWDGAPDGRGSDIEVDGNLLAGAGWTVCAGTECPLWDSSGQVIGYEPLARRWADVRVTNNHFSTRFHPACGAYGPIAYTNGDGVSGNVWHDGPLAAQPLTP